MTRIWPDTLPTVIIPGYRLSPVDQSIRTEMEVGAKRLRRISQARADTVSVAWKFKDAEMTAFRAWHGDEAWSLAGDSEDLSSWSRLNASLSADAINGPSLQGADVLVENTDSGFHRTQLELPAVVDGDVVVFTASLKAQGRSEVRMGLVDRAGVLRYVDVDLDAATLSGASGLLSSSIARRGNSWRRVVITAEADIGVSDPTLRLSLLDSGTLSYTGDGASGVAICEVNARLQTGYDLFLPTDAQGNAIGAAGGSAWVQMPLAFGGGFTTVEARFEEPFNAEVASGLHWQVSSRLEVRHA